MGNRLETGMNHTNIQKLFDDNEPARIPRGELWVGTNLLRNSGLEDDLSGHIQLRKQLGMDFFFLPVSGSGNPSTSMDYRYYTPDDVRKAVGGSDLSVGIIVDGPFQRLVSRKGLTPVLMALKTNGPQLAREMRREADEVMRIVSQCLEWNIGAVVIADDLAYQNGTYMSPEDTESLVTPFYSALIPLIHAKGASALFHSCGNIAGILDPLVTCGFNGLAACQGQCLDLLEIKETYQYLTLLAGIDSDMLESDAIDEKQKREFGEKILSLAKGGRFILASSCGLYSRNACRRLRKLYETIDLCCGERT